ncbi:hypothetical protein M0804_013413 [Polistes exclamans]|nr:hypothetical protein M0804_013413 [Polistes exclamans]
MRSDKGNHTVIMKKEEYLNEMHKMLQNKDIYQLLNKDPTSKFEKLANNLIMKLRKESIITEEIEKSMKSYNSVAPKIYGLRKTHKQSLALRPVIAFNTSSFRMLVKREITSNDTMSEIDRSSPRDIRKLKLRTSKVKKIAAIFEVLIEKTAGEAMKTLVNKIHNYVKSVIDSKAETELIINRAESVATEGANSPITSLSSSVRTTVISPSVDSIYRIPAVQLPHFDGQHEKSLSIADMF